MEPEQSAQLESIFQHMSVGVAILDCPDLRLLYANPYLLSLLDQAHEAGRPQAIISHSLYEIIPEELLRIALPLLQQACSTGQRMSWSDIPYEGFLATRGRTYWRVSVERSEREAESLSISERHETRHTFAPLAPLLVTIEDVTELARSRLYVNAIDSISSAIVGPFALPLVLERILQAVQDMVGSTRCAILLIDDWESGSDFRYPGYAGVDPDLSRGERSEEPGETHTQADTPSTVTIAAQKGVHLRSQDWHPQLSEQLLLGRVARDRRTLVITDTSTTPEMNFPLLDDEGIPRRPGSALCIPIFEPTPDRRLREGPIANGAKETITRTGRVLGTIEVYHRRARGFPAEEVELLEQFAQQAGLAIQNARLFLRINQLARDASRNLRQREHIMQAIPDGVIIYDPRWRVVDANQAIRKLLGWTNDVIGLHITEALARSTALFSQDYKSIDNFVSELDRRVMERRVDEVKIIGADGKPYTLSRSYAPIHDDLGDIFASVVIYHDMTEQVAARERIEAEVAQRTAELAQRNTALELAKAEQDLASARMELLLERLPSGVILISADDKSISIINRQAAQILQSLGLPIEPLDSFISIAATPLSRLPTVSSDEMKYLDAATRNAIGKNAEELFRLSIVYAPSGSLVPYEESPLALALDKGEANEAELHSLQSDGQAIYLLVSAAPLRASDGTITSAVLVLHEITKLKTLERAREDFFTTMAHELKTPLANIRAHVSALLAEDLLWSPEAQRNFLQSADEQVDRLVGMINHFLDASRVEAGALRLELEPILLPEMLEDLQERLEALIANSGRQLEIKMPPFLPAVMADYELIMSVLTNLLSNAFRYAPEGDTVILEVKPVYRSGDLYPTGVELRVTDRGPGMSLDQQTALFTRFSTFAAMSRPAIDRPGQPTAERRRGSARWSPATGLGLYISRGIIEAHGSKLALQSSPGEGASFSFILPCIVADRK
jgi:PAS domain S-box-containing protein